MLPRKPPVLSKSLSCKSKYLYTGDTKTGKCNVGANITGKMVSVSLFSHNLSYRCKHLVVQLTVITPPAFGCSHESFHTSDTKQITMNYMCSVKCTTLVFLQSSTLVILTPIIAFYLLHAEKMVLLF